MVALLGLLEHVEVGLLVLLLRPGGAVDALEHLVLRVAAPIGACDLHQLEYLQLARRRHVRPAAEVDEIPLAIERHVLAFGNRRDDLGLVLLSDRQEELDRLVARPHFARNADILPGELGHALLDRGEVLGREGPLIGEVVVEAVLDHRTDRHLRVGEEILHRIGEQVRRRVPDDLEALRVALGDDGDRRVGLDPVRRVDQASVDPAGDGRLRETGTDRLSDFGDRDRGRKSLLGAVG